MRRSLAVGLVLTIGLGSSAPGRGRQPRPRHAILITLDGARTEEIFGGLDRVALASTTRDGTIEGTEAYTKFWADGPEARRRKVMPFFWGTLMATDGSIAGNRARGSRFGVTNHKRFSYPGYAEILTGQAHDDTIDSNDNKRYPFATVLEFLRHRWAVGQDQIAVFGSWETFHWIAGQEEGAVAVNAGYEAFGSPDPAIQALSRAQFEAQTPWSSARHDAFTFRFAMDYLRRVRPRVLYVAFDETDDWAHDKSYDRVLEALARTDGELHELWTWLQGDAEYHDNTAILITVDHGRGHTASDWSKHGEDVTGADETWLAAIGPDWPRRGEWTDAPPAFTNQVAATLARSVGEDFRTAAPGAGAPIDYLWGRP